MKLLLYTLLFLSCGGNLHSQVFQSWVQRYGNAPDGIANLAGIKADKSGNVFIAGSVLSSTLTDYATIKYNSAGIQEWVRIFSAQIEDRAIDLVLDNEGNVIVTGLSENLTGTYDIVTIKYNTSGDSLWVKRFNGATAFTMDQPVAIDADNNGNVYVCGYSFGTTPTTFITIKYNFAGDSVWIARNLIGGTTLPLDIKTDNDANVIVYGRGARVLKFDTNGNLLWNNLYQFTAAESNKSIATDSSGNIYLAAVKKTVTFDDFAVIKLNSVGDTLWTRVRNGFGGSVTTQDDPKAICVDNSGNVYITGEIYNFGSYHFSTIKYNAIGEFQWEKNYNSPQNGFGGKDIVCDNSGNVYVTGGSGDYSTIKYSPDGDSLWVIRYNGPANLNDISMHMTIDLLNNVYVSGRSSAVLSPAVYEFATIKYSQIKTNITMNESHDGGFRLGQNYPNPFNPLTVIDFEVPYKNHVMIRVYNLLGKEVMTIFNELAEAGSHSVKFSGNNLPGGIYFYTLQSGETRIVKKFTLIK